MRISLDPRGLVLSLAATSQEIWRWVERTAPSSTSDQPDSPNAELIDVIGDAYEGEAATPDSGTSGSGARARIRSRPILRTTRSRSSSRSPIRCLRLDADGLGGGRTRGRAAVRSLGRVLPDGTGARQRVRDELSGFARGTYFLRAVSSTGMASP